MAFTNVLLGGEGLLGKALKARLEVLGEKTVSFDLKSGFDLRTDALPAFSAETYVWFLAWDVGGAKYIMDERQQLTILRSNVRLCESVFDWLNETKLPFSFISTQMIDYKNAYGITKRMAEFWASTIGQGMIARLWNIYDAEKSSEKSHVIPDLVGQGKAGKIKLMTQGNERRQFLHAQDCADALIHQRKIRQPMAEITSGAWVPIREVAQIIADQFNARVQTGSVMGYESLVDPTIPLKDWHPRIDLKTGLRKVVETMKNNGWA